MADAFKAEIEDLKKKLSQNPDSLTFVPLAEAYRKSGMYKEAVDVCKAGLEKHPAYTSARVVLGRLYLEQELYDEAAEELKKVEVVDHDNIMVHSMLGNIYVKKQMFAQAVEQFQRVLSLNPEDMETQDKLQEALSAKQTVPSESKKEEKIAPPPPAAKEEKPAMTDLQKSLKVAELYSKKEEFDKAIEVYRELLEKDAENIIIQQRLREVYDLQQKKINKQKEQSEKRKSAESDKITAEDILDVMKEAVENDLVDEEKTEPPAKKEEPKKEAKKEEPKKEEVKKEEPKKEEPRKEEPKKEEPKKEEPKKEEVKKEEPKKEEAKKETVEKAPEISDNKKIEIGNVLQSLSTVDGIVGSLFLLRDGQLVASVLPTTINKSEIGGIVASIVDKTEQSVKNMKQGKLNQVVIASEHGQLLFTELGKGVLFIIGDENINVGKMGLVLKQVKEKMKQLM
ncbi:MAG TPA: tetratricopeptide repeat protein [Candidatus Goldiibacteriota bacterium]|nr:tetratricopeptide repeat protein [Candidatus Goldiibacteriota bacterium]HRQ44404.1 tetratricopeptide repeat protein [Candidatus Goldiibacteriota bacterium]